MILRTPEQTSKGNGTIYRFGNFEVLTASGELFHNGVRLRLQEQSLQVLLALLEAPGAVVTREQLQQRLWPDGTCVDFEHSLNAAVKRLRAALGDDADNPRYIETLPRRGYRLVTPVSSDKGQETPSAEATDGPTAEVPQRLRNLWTLAGAAALVVLAAVLLLRWNHRIQTISGANLSFGGWGKRRGEANELYLRSLRYRLEAPDNAQGISLLERATKLNPDSASSWVELARRYEVEYVNAGRGPGFLQQAREANRHARDIDPDFLPAQAQQAAFEVDGGQAIEGYRRALALTRAHPQNASAHLALAYALRAGGMYQESASECDLALKLNATNPGLRSCALVHTLLGQYDRAQAYLELDPLSTYVRYRRIELGILRNQRGAALEMARSIRVGPNDYPDARMIEAVLSGSSTETVRKWSQETEALSDRISLPEGHFIEARYLAWSGQTEAAVRLLRRAIANNYCSYPVIDSDPFWASVRLLPAYKELRQAGITCRDNFRTQM